MIEHQKLNLDLTTSRYLSDEAKDLILQIL